MRIKLFIATLLCFSLVSCSSVKTTSSSPIDSILNERQSLFSHIEELGFNCYKSNEDLVFKDREYLVLEKDNKTYKFSSSGDINIISQIVENYDVRIVSSFMYGSNDVIVELIGLGNEGVVTNRYEYGDYSSLGDNEESGRFIATIISEQFISDNVNDLGYVFKLLKDL